MLYGCSDSSEMKNVPKLRENSGNSREIERIVKFLLFLDYSVLLKTLSFNDHISHTCEVGN